MSPVSVVNTPWRIKLKLVTKKHYIIICGVCTFVTTMKKANVKGTSHNFERGSQWHPVEKSVQIQKHEKILCTNKNTYYKVLY